MRVTFTADVLHETIGRGQGQRYEAGSTHDFREDYAQKWISQGVATPAVEEVAVEPEPAPVVEPEQEASLEAKIIEDPEGPDAPETPRHRGRHSRS